jgi:hypothetical protein
VLDRAAALLRAHGDDFARLATLEMGKRIDEARAEVSYSAEILAYYARHAERMLAPVALQPTLGAAHVECSPLGVLFCVEPWNFPYYQLARVAGAQLMAGNVLVVKHLHRRPGRAVPCRGRRDTPRRSASRSPLSTWGPCPARRRTQLPSKKPVPRVRSPAPALQTKSASSPSCRAQAGPASSPNTISAVA